MQKILYGIIRIDRLHSLCAPSEYHRYLQGHRLTFLALECRFLMELNQLMVQILHQTQ